MPSLWPCPGDVSGHVSANHVSELPGASAGGGLTMRFEHQYNGILLHRLVMVAGPIIYTGEWATFTEPAFLYVPNNATTYVAFTLRAVRHNLIEDQVYEVSETAFAWKQVDI